MSHVAIINDVPSHERTEEPFELRLTQWKDAAGSTRRTSIPLSFQNGWRWGLFLKVPKELPGEEAKVSFFVLERKWKGGFEEYFVECPRSDRKYVLYFSDFISNMLPSEFTVKQEVAVVTSSQQRGWTWLKDGNQIQMDSPERSSSSSWFLCCCARSKAPKSHLVRSNDSSSSHPSRMVTNSDYLPLPVPRRD
eukprot:GILJ01007945.1.p1 GENE.GILJ01007945.1~~GILJ01007945.1.p1  ORF type:complete len:193 (-),score=10.92 GILJ01007945.1:188-766(-)